MTTTQIDLQKLRKHLAHHMKTTQQVTTILTNAGIKEPELTQIITTTVEDVLSEMGAYQLRLHNLHSRVT